MNWPKWCNMSSKPYDNAAPNGLLLIDKPKDFSSHDIIAVARRVLQTRKIGHSGTLDPMATGLLILLIGRSATKEQARFLGLDKTYEATLSLGQETDSWDAYGTVVSEQAVPPLTLEQVQRATQTLSGEIEQPIPFFSAKKINGKPMYALARQGKELERKYNRVTVSWSGVRLVDPQTITFTVHCSCGTYVRALGHLLAQALGTAGHLTQLRRTHIGPFCVTDAFDGAALKQTAREILFPRILPV